MSVNLVEPDLTLPARDFLPEMGLRKDFNPELYSLQERRFLLDGHLEESPAVALKGWDATIPHGPTDPEPSVNPWCAEHEGVNPKTIRTLLSRLRDLKELHGDEGFGEYTRDASIAGLIGKKVESFRGIEAIRACIEDSIEYHRRFNVIKRRDPDSAIHPTMHTKDARGRLHKQGPGSDRGMVRAMTCSLLAESMGTVPDAWADAVRMDGVAVGTPEAAKVEGAGAAYELIMGENFYECPVKGCNKRCEFDANDEGAQSKAKGAMHRHFNMTTKQVDDHKEAALVIFGS
jgi:hypothetical protein